MRLAGIDIGTNTVLLLVAEIGAGGRVTALAEEQEIPRLGRDVDRSGKISAAGFEALGLALNRYRAIALSHGVTRITACATSAVRDASNREDLLGYIRGAAGMDIEVIDGATEADLTFRGVLSGREGDWADPAVLDIGGGSTELCYARRGATDGDRTLTRVSMEIGSVRLTERFFRHSHPLAGEIATARAWIVEELARIVNPGFGDCTLIAVAGTATTLAGLHLGLPEFNPAKIDGCRIPAGAVRAMASRLFSMNAGAIRALSTMTAGREDILAAGALILSTIVDHFGVREIRVSTRGLRYGIVLREWKRRGDDAGTRGGD
ncbi:MAG TPA: Ppx/GppA phosphatase family protein [Bacteroidota bacterium]|nr:Ppx/GppA phosphatase family protein [Bacteroidota bacterium]